MLPGRWRLIVWLVCLAASANTGQAFAETLRVGGAGSMIRAAMNFSELFEKAHPGLTVVVEPGSSRSAVNGVRAGKLDIGLVGHAIPPRDRNGLSIVPIKKEAILLVTYPANPVASLSLAQIRGVYRGEISNWARLGGEAQAIVPFTRWQNSMIRRIFLRIAFGNEAGIQEKAFRIPKDKVLRTIKKIQGSLGYTPTTLEVARGSDVKILAVDGHEPTRQNVQRGAYPFSRTMVVISADAPNAILLDWMNGFAKFVQEESEARQR